MTVNQQVHKKRDAISMCSPDDGNAVLNCRHMPPVNALTGAHQTRAKLLGLLDG